MLGMPQLPPTSPRGVGNLRGDETFPAAARHALADTQLRRNLGKATRTIRAKRAAGGRGAARLGGAAGGRAAAQGAHHGAPAGLPGAVRGGGHGPGRDRALGARRGRGQPDRDRPGPRQGRRRGGQGQVHGHPGDRAQRGPRGRRDRRPGDRPRRADRAAGPRQAVAHPGAGDPPQPGRDPGDLPARDGRRRPRR